MSTDHSDSELDDTRLSRYLAGESTASEKADVEAWLAADPARREQLASLATAWETAGRPPRHQTAGVDTAWTKMTAAIDRAEARPLRPWANPALRVAAAILIVAGALGGLGVWRATRAPVGAATAAVTYETARGERETIGIGDGTTVVLGPASRLVVAAGFGGSSREVTLEGEALFTVRHDETKPFRVHVGGSVVEDLGTEFSVRAYAPSDTLRVVVTSGVVMLTRAAAPADTLGVVRAGEVGLLAEQGAALVSPVSNASTLLAWSTGQLVFDDTPMSRVASELARWYDVDVRVDSSLAWRHVTVAFSGDSLGDVARVLGATLGARVEREGRVVTFRAGGAAR